MGRRKKSTDSEINDMCLACQFYEWQEDKRKYVCVTYGCKNNSEFKVYTPRWLRREQEEAQAECDKRNSDKRFV